MRPIPLRLTPCLSLAFALSLAGCEADPSGPLAPGAADDARSPIATVSSSASDVVVVSADNFRGWFFYQDSAPEGVDNTLGSFVTGPGTPQHGIGSAQISTSGTSRPNLATYQFAGTPLGDITELAYSTHNGSAGNPGSPTRAGYLQFNVDFDGSDTWQRRMVYLPKDNGAVIQDSWQTWDAIGGGSALWRYSGPTWPGTLIAGTTPRTWTDILAAYPGVRIRATDAFLGIRVGEPYADGYTENIDALTFGTLAGGTIFDFEPYEVAVSEEQCKDGGWAQVKRADGSAFANQGDCVQYVVTGK